MTRFRYDGSILADGQPVRTIDRLKSGTVLTARYDAPDEAPAGLELVPEPNSGITVLWQDDWIVVASKPAGLLTHPNYKGEMMSLITAWGGYTLHPVNRLDRDTSGVVLLTRNGYAHSLLNEAEIGRRYLGLVHGTFRQREGVIDAPIERAEDSIIRREITEQGKEARTRYEVLEDRITKEGEPVQLVLFTLETGRTHQIRLHCLHAGHTLVGETLYTDRPGSTFDDLIGRQALHALWLRFTHPISGEELTCFAPVPEDFMRLYRGSRRLR